MATKKTTRKATTKTKKVRVAKTTVPRKKTVSPIIRKTRNLHKLNLAAQLALAALVIFMMKPVIYALSLGFVTKDALLSDAGTVFVPAEKVLLDFDIRWSLLALIAASAIYSALVLSRWRASYEKAQAGRVYLWRWVILAITGAVMIKLASIVSGVEDITMIKMAGGLMMAAMAFAWLSETRHVQTGQRASAPFWLALVSGLMAMYGILASLVGTTLFGLIRLPWYAYALDAVVLIGFLVILWNLRRSNRRAGQSNDYPYVERNYVIIAMLTQFLFVAVIVAGLAT